MRTCPRGGWGCSSSTGSVVDIPFRLRARAEDSLSGAPGVAPVELDHDPVSRLLGLDHLAQLGGRGDRLAVEADDHVTPLEPGVLGGLAGGDLVDPGAAV